jgi:hypothetical protein
MARNEVWQSELGLWQDVLAKSPGKARPHANVAAMLQRSGDYEAAIPHYCDALRIDPKFATANIGLDLALQARLERIVEEEGIDLEDPSDQVEVRRLPGGRRMLVPRNPCWEPEPSGNLKAAGG